MTPNPAFEADVRTCAFVHHQITAARSATRTTSLILVGNGCHENSKATWCKVRSCCTEKHVKTCADCAEYPDPCACKKYDNFMSKLFGLVFKSNRAACIAQIKQLGLDGHAKAMAEMRTQTIKR